MRSTHKTLAVVGGALFAALLTSLLTVIIAGGEQARPESSGEYEAEAAERAADSQGVSVALGSGSLQTEQLLLPNEGEALMRWEWRLHREPKSAWGEADLSRYWIDPSEISIDYLVEQNNELMQEMFRSVP